MCCTFGTRGEGTARLGERQPGAISETFHHPDFALNCRCWDGKVFAIGGSNRPAGIGAPHLPKLMYISRKRDLRRARLRRYRGALDKRF
jgi:hypothetical protein